MKNLEKLLAEATPGPWVEGCDEEILTDNGSIVVDSCAIWNPEDASLIALAPSLAAALLVAEKALRPFSEMAGEMFAANWNDDGVAISFVTKDGPMRITFKEFREARTALSEIAKLTGGGE